MKCFLPLLRTFLLAVALVTAGCEPADDPAPAADEAADQTFTFEGDFEGPLGLQLYSIRHALEEDVPGTLAKVRDMGFREVELAGTYGMRPEQFRRELDEAGLDATAMHVSYERLRDSLNTVLDEAETLGAEYVGVAWIPHPEGQPFTEEMARQTAADFNRWGQAASERGLQFFYHVHGFEFRPGADGTTPFDVLVEETDPEDVKYEMDVFWVAHPGVDPAALLRKYPDRWALMHVKDMKQGTPTPDYTGHASAEANVPVGSGQINYREVLEAAEEIGIDHYYIEDETTDPMANIPQSTEYLETVRYES